jgi:hypothetical protein
LTSRLVTLLAGSLNAAYPVPPSASASAMHAITVAGEMRNFRRSFMPYKYRLARTAKRNLIGSVRQDFVKDAVGCEATPA